MKVSLSTTQPAVCVLDLNTELELVLKLKIMTKPGIEHIIYILQAVDLW